MTIEMLTFSGAFLLFGAIFFGCGMIPWNQSKTASKWPNSEGLVEECQLKEINDGDHTTYKVDVKYSYLVDTRRYENTRIGFGYSGSHTLSNEQKLSDKLRKAGTIIVRYDPEHPAHAILSEGLQYDGFKFMMLGAGLMLFSITTSLMFWLVTKE